MLCWQPFLTISLWWVEILQERTTQGCQHKIYKCHDLIWLVIVMEFSLRYNHHVLKVSEAATLRDTTLFGFSFHASGMTQPRLMSFGENRCLFQFLFTQMTATMTRYYGLSHSVISWQMGATETTGLAWRIGEAVTSSVPWATLETTQSAMDQLT